ncbi:MAG: hypothetical protein ACPGJE_08850, partial [Wenzhouxiangellaceae bacterium]
MSSSSNHSVSQILQDLPPPQELLPLGYLYLLLLGIANQSIFFGMLGVNVLAYSDALDVLISPISTLTGNPIVLIAVAAIIVLLLPYLWLVRAILRRTRPEKLKQGWLALPLAKAWLRFAVVGMLFAFLGLGLGAGMAQSERLAAGDTKLNHRIEFLDGVVEEVELVGKNSGYVFFIRPDSTVVTIAPVADNIRTIQR